MSAQPAPSASPPPASEPEMGEGKRRLIIALVVVAVLVLIAGLAAALIFLVGHPGATETIRDIFIIVMAVESLFIGAALVVLMAQLAQLTNLLRHEIKPILDSTNDTVSTVRGTALFLSENLVDPVMKLTGYVAGLERLLKLLNPTGTRK